MLAIQYLSSLYVVVEHMIVLFLFYMRLLHSSGILKSSVVWHSLCGCTIFDYDEHILYDCCTKIIDQIHV